jgi:hypothetical protein
VRLVFDTGAEAICLFRSTARRLGLKASEPGPGAKALAGRVLAGISEECEFSISEVTTRIRFPVFDPPEETSPRDIDGLLAWYPFRDHVFLLSPQPVSITTLPALPEDIASWAKWPISPKQRALTIEVFEFGGQRGVILIDTGSFSGAELNAQRWQQWREAHKDFPTSPVAFFTPASGLLVREECWADQLDIAGFRIANVPVMQGRPDVEDFVGADATLGLAALSRLEVIIDGARGNFYTRPVSTPPAPYKHNRLGAVFAPKDLESQDLIGYVIEGSPAYQAGIRNGDVLLGVDALDVTKWRTDPNMRPSKFWEQPAGTEHRLTLMREGKRFERAVTLRDILGPRSSTSAPPAVTPPSSTGDANQR